MVLVSEAPFVTAGAPSSALPASGCMYCLYVDTAVETFMQAEPEPQRSGSLKENKADEPAAIADVALAFQDSRRPTSSL